MIVLRGSMFRLGFMFLYSRLLDLHLCLCGEFIKSLETLGFYCDWVPVTI